MRVFAAATVLSVHPAGRPTTTLRTAHRAAFQYVPKDGMIYVRSRAISSRCNDNWDYFGAEEIKKAYRTFVGKPVFVNHVNDDHKRMRGLIIDAALHEDRNPDGSPDTWAEVLMEIDGRKFPKLARALVNGWIDRTSMGTDVQLSRCSACGNEATTPLEYCEHIPGKKGSRILVKLPDGRREAKLVYEECIGLGFFENSLLVEPPADPTAFFLGNVELGPGLGHLAKMANVAPPSQPPQSLRLDKPVDESSINTYYLPSLLRHQAALAPSFSPERGSERVWRLLAEATVREAKAKKPVGDMSDAEYAQHQQTVAKEKADGESWNRKNPVKIKNIVAHWNQATEDEKSNGENWYADAHHLAGHIARDTGTPMHVMAGLMSNYSPQTHWSTNIMNAARVARTGVGLGGRGEGIMATANQKRAANRMLSGEHYDQVLAGPKTRAFAHLIEHGGNADPNDPKVVVDRHALSVAAGSRASDNAYMYSRLGTKSRYHEVSQAYHKAAKQISRQEGRPIAAHQVQAATWLTRQRLNEQEDRALSETASSGSTSQARLAVAKWNSYASEHHPAAIGKEPGTGYSTAVPEDVQHARQMHDQGVPNPKAASLLAMRPDYVEPGWLRALAYGETKAPRTVDTLRDEACPICGNDTAYAGRECQICGYILPIKAFGDPDVDKAKELDQLKQTVDDQLLAADPSRAGADFEDQAAAGDDSASPVLGCPGCGTEFEPEPPQTADAPGTASQTGPAEGDVCPECNEGELQPVAQLNAEVAPEDPEDDELDQDKDQLPDDEEQEDQDVSNPASRKRKASKYRNARRLEGDPNAMNGLQAMAAQQQLIDAQSAQLRAALQQNAHQATQIQRLTAAVATLARAGGVELEGKVRVAMIRKRADEQNPAQPIPEPAPQPATQSTQEAKTPEAFADVTAPGMVPGSTQDVAADAVTTAYTPGQDIGAAPFRNLVDVTAPVEGTQGPRPINETRTEVDVRAGNPMNPQVAFPIGGPFTQQQRTTGSAQGSESQRFVASLRLARLQIQAGIAEGEDLAIAQRIASDGNRTDELIAHEIATLSSVRTASQANVQTPPRGLVPRAAGLTRTVPLVPAMASAGGGATDGGSDDDLNSIFLPDL